jgi:hypothetical protein
MTSQLYFTTPYQMVGEFHTMFGHRTSSIFDVNYCENNKDAICFRLGLISEELEELRTAFIKLYEHINKENQEGILREYAEVIDACADLTYVLNGTLHYIGYNPDMFDINSVLHTSHVSEAKIRRFTPCDNQTYAYSTLLIQHLTTTYKYMEEQYGNTKTIVMAVCHMLNIIISLSSAMGFSILEASTIVHDSNMTKLCYSHEETNATILKYKCLYAETNDLKYKYPTSRVVKEGKIWMVCNMDPSKSSDCAKVLKSINFKQPDFKDIISRSFNSINFNRENDY